MGVVIMIIKRLKVKNWRNFRELDVPLRERQFIVGANASGKSNLLDIFRFLRDIVKAEGGGLQKAVKDRGGVSKIRSLAARQDPEIAIEIYLADNAESPESWRYAIGIRQEPRGYRQPFLTYERVWKGDQQILNRPDAADKGDPQRLTQTFLEQINVNANFRDIVYFLQDITYLHLVPQLLRFADSIQGRVVEDDPFGQGFLERIATASERTRRSRLQKIEQALKIAVPQLKQLEFIRDEITGRPHLQALYSHWRPNAGLQREDQFSDGTLRLLGLLWSLLESDSVLLLEEPELSLNAGIVSQLAPFISRMQRSRRPQVFVSTHSDALLTEQGIDGGEVLLLTPAREGTAGKIVSDIDEVQTLLEAGFTVGEAVLPRTRPEHVEQLSFLE
jgi:predicted ATPase